VEAQDTDTGATRATTTDERGVYLFNNLQTGNYKVTATAGSFR